MALDVVDCRASEDGWKLARPSARFTGDSSALSSSSGLSSRGKKPPSPLGLGGEGLEGCITGRIGNGAWGGLQEAWWRGLCRAAARSGSPLDTLIERCVGLEDLLAAVVSEVGRDGWAVMMSGRVLGACADADAVALSVARRRWAIAAAVGRAIDAGLEIPASVLGDPPWVDGWGFAGSATPRVRGPLSCASRGAEELVASLRSEEGCACEDRNGRRPPVLIVPPTVGLSASEMATL